MSRTSFHQVYILVDTFTRSGNNYTRKSLFIRVTTLSRREGTIFEKQEASSSNGMILGIELRNETEKTAACIIPGSIFPMFEVVPL